MRILVVEDEPKMTALLARAEIMMVEDCYDVAAMCGGQFISAARRRGGADVMCCLGIDGSRYALARLRRQRVDTGAMLTARGAVTDRIGT